MSPEKVTPIKRDTHKHPKIKILQTPEPVSQPSYQSKPSLSPKPSRPPRSHSKETQREHFISTRSLSACPIRHSRTFRFKRICNVDALGVQTEFNHEQKKALGPLLKLKPVCGKDVENLENFPDVIMVTTFVQSAVSRATKVWHILRRAEQARSDVRLADWELLSLKRMNQFCAGRVPVYVHPSLYWSIKLACPLDVGGMSHDDQVTTELGTGSLEQAVGILKPKDLQSVVDTGKKGKSVWLLTLPV